MMRQYEGLKSLSSIKPNLQRAIFSNPEDKTYSNKPSEGISACLKIKPPSAVPQGVWKHLISTMNAAQLSAIEKVMAGKVRENVALLQGPPGKLASHPRHFSLKYFHILSCLSHRSSFVKGLGKHLQSLVL